MKRILLLLLFSLVVSLPHYTAWGQTKDVLKDKKTRKQIEEYWYLKGRHDLDSNKYEEAIKDFTEEIKLIPKDVVSINCRGYAKEKLGNYKGAIKEYRKALKLIPTDPLVENNLNRVLELQKNSKSK